MKTRNIPSKLPCLSLFFAALSMSGCISDRFEAAPAEKTGEFTFLIRVPGNASPSSAAATRAIDEGGTSDNRVDAVDILLFDASTDKFVRSVYCMNIDETGDVRVKSVRARLPQGSYEAVILANSHRQLIDHPVSEGTLKSAALAQFTETLDYGTVWNSLPGSTGYRDFPMWGEVAGTVTVPSAGTITVDLYRMLAKVNLSVAYTETTPGTPDFVLKDIRVYNYNRSGYLAPTDADWAANPKQPTHYASREYPANQTTPTALLYDNTTGTNATRTPKYITTDAAGKFYKSVDEIFIFESAADNSTWSWEKNTCLVLGGEYKGLMGYYRIDFAQSNVNIDILRNHSYNFSVEAVRNQGYATPEEALKNRPENMLYNIVVWDENEIGDIYFDGQNYLSFRPGNYAEFYKDPETQEIGIKTDVDAGWRIVKITEDDGSTPIDQTTGWLTTDRTTGTLYPCAGNYLPLNVSVTDNDTGNPRTGYIYIEAGRLEARITVLQNEYGQGSLSITDDALNPILNLVWFTEADEIPVAKKYQVNWEPRTSTLKSVKKQVQIIDASYYPYVEWQSWRMVSGLDDNTVTDIYLTDIANGSGMVEFTVQPKAFTAIDFITDPFPVRRTQVDYTVGTGSAAISQKIVFQHSVYRAFAETMPAYGLDGNLKSFTIKANADYTIEIVDEQGNNPDCYDGNPAVTLASPAPYVYTANTTGTTIEFTTGNDLSNPNLTYYEVKLLIKSPDGKFTDKEVTLIVANCGANGVAIPRAIGTNGYSNAGASGNTYLTHRYGEGANCRCWMVQNSREGTASYTTYPGHSAGERGYYYAPAVIATNVACPSGWRMPTLAEAQVLQGVVNAVGNINTNVGGSQFWAGTTFTNRAGSYELGGANYGWHGWGSHDSWWYQNGSNAATNFSGTTTLTIQSGTFDSYHRTIRCVKN